jgi:hypothetical protein
MPRVRRAMCWVCSASGAVVCGKDSDAPAGSGVRVRSVACVPWLAVHSACLRSRKGEEEEEGAMPWRRVRALSVLPCEQRARLRMHAVCPHPVLLAARCTSLSGVGSGCDCKPCRAGAAAAAAVGQLLQAVTPICHMWWASQTCRPPRAGPGTVRCRRRCCRSVVAGLQGCGEGGAATAFLLFDGWVDGPI